MAPIDIQMAPALAKKRCGTCGFAHADATGQLFCWGFPPINYENNVFKREAPVDDNDHACYIWSQK